MRGHAAASISRPNIHIASLTLGLGAFLLLHCGVDDRALLTTEPGPSGGGTDATTRAGSGGRAADPEAPGGGAAGATDAAEGGTQFDTGGGASAGAPAIDPGPCPDLDQNSVPDCEETLAQNSTFDQSAAHWVAETNVNQDWYAKDADGRRGSGSLGVVNSNMAQIPNLSLGGSRQCIAISGGGRYSYEARAFIEKGQGASGSGGLFVSFYESADCTGTRMDSFGGTSPLASGVGAWSPLQFESEAPGNAESMSVEMIVIKAFTEPSLTVLFDDILVKAKE